jgi:cytochrome b
MPESAIDARDGAEGAAPGGAVPGAPNTALTPVAVWDLPTRLAHWLFVAGVAISWWTAETGRLEWHRWSGYGLLGVLLFRLYWGFAGGSTARFGNFVRGPRAVRDYLKGEWPTRPGHNPLGALSVLGLLGLLLLQVVLGLFAVDVDGIESGPLSLYVSFETGRACAEWHEWTFNALMASVTLHLLAVVYYLVVKRQNLVGAMVTGKRSFAGEMAPLTASSALKLAIGILLASAITWAVARAFNF